VTAIPLVLDYVDPTSRARRRVRELSRNRNIAQRSDILAKDRIPYRPDESLIGGYELAPALHCKSQIETVVCAAALGVRNAQTPFRSNSGRQKAHSDVDVVFEKYIERGFHFFGSHLSAPNSLPKNFGEFRKEQVGRPQVVASVY
jgi:hypothetical protein